MANTNSYHINNSKSVYTIGKELVDYLEKSRGMETQLLRTEDNGVIVQGRVNGSKWKKFIGMDRAITVNMSEKNRILKVDIGAGKWLDKGVVMTVSMFVLWPLALTSGLGIYKQKKLPEKIYKFIEKAVL